MNFDNSNKHHIKLQFKPTRQNLMAVINHKLDIRQMLGEKHYTEMIDYLESQKNEADMIKFLTTPVGVYAEPTKEPKIDVLTAIVEKYSIIISEQWEFRHESMDENGRGVINDKQLSCYPLYVRANQQIGDKEGKSAESDSGRNVAGQVSSKESKSGAFTDSEITVGIAQSADAVMKELLGPASHDLAAKKEMKRELYQTGKASLKSLPNDSSNKRSVTYFDHILKALGIDTDLVEPVLHK